MHRATVIYKSSSVLLVPRATEEEKEKLGCVLDLKSCEIQGGMRFNKKYLTD
jgi:hypothetical protein